MISIFKHLFTISILNRMRDADFCWLSFPRNERLTDHIGAYCLGVFVETFGLCCELIICIGVLLYSIEELIQSGTIFSDYFLDTIVQIIFFSFFCIVSTILCTKNIIFNIELIRLTRKFSKK